MEEQKNKSFWTGVVEDSRDPLKLGRVRVRIFGVHSPDKAVLPTDKLPWAMLSIPTNSSTSFSWLREGSWVTGYFLDINLYQLPVITNVLVGLESSQSIQTYRASNHEVSSPHYNPTEGLPILPPSAIGNIERTPIAVTNRQRSHVCDISQEVIRSNSLIRARFGVIIENIRKGLRAAIKALGLSERSGEIAKVIQMAKTIAREIKKIREIIEEVAEVFRLIEQIAIQLRAMLDYILSLPERIRRFLVECINRLNSALLAGVQELFAAPLRDFTELRDSIREIQDESRGLVSDVKNLAAIPDRIADAIVNPASPLEIERAGAIFNSAVSEAFPGNEELISDVTFIVNKSSI
jgi:hypothetical protein